MKTPGILEGIMLAIAASIAGGIMALLLPLLFGEFASARILITMLGLGYLLYLLKRSRERSGRVFMVALWALASIAALLLDASLLGFVLVQAALIWIVRSLYFHGSVLAALIDLGLTAFGLLAGVWALLQTGSLTTAVWCFFLTQCLFVWIPNFAGGQRPSFSNDPVACDRFQSAHRVAQDAVRKLSTHSTR